jgi:hypothetical protein
MFDPTSQPTLQRVGMTSFAFPACVTTRARIPMRAQHAKVSYNGMAGSFAPYQSAERAAPVNVLLPIALDQCQR